MKTRLKIAVYQRIARAIEDHLDEAFQQIADGVERPDDWDKIAQILAETALDYRRRAQALQTIARTATNA